MQRHASILRRAGCPTSQRMLWAAALLRCRRLALFKRCRPTSQPPPLSGRACDLQQQRRLCCCGWQALRAWPGCPLRQRRAAGRRPPAARSTPRSAPLGGGPPGARPPPAAPPAPPGTTHSDISSSLAATLSPCQLRSQRRDLRLNLAGRLRCARQARAPPAPRGTLLMSHSAWCSRWDTVSRLMRLRSVATMACFTCTHGSAVKNCSVKQGQTPSQCEPSERHCLP